MNKGRQLAMGGMLLALFSVLLLITIYVPLLGIFVMFIMPIPFIFVALDNEIKWSLVFLLAASFLTIILGHVLSLPLTLMMGSIGITIGSYLRNNRSRMQMFIVSVLLFIASMLVIFIGSFVLLGINYIEKTIERLELIIEQSGMMMTRLGQGDESLEMLAQLKDSLQLVEVLLPSFIVISSVVVVGVLFLSCKPIINRFSHKKLQISPIRELQLPKSLLWYYLFVMVVSMFVGPTDGFMYTVVINLLFCLQFFVLLQGYSFLFYISEVKKLSKAVPIAVVVFSILLPFASIIAPFIRILGIIDLGFGLRNKIK